MENSPINMLINKNLRPSYYDDFECIGSDCRVSCCANWDIAFNKKDYLSLKKLKRSAVLSKRIDNALCRLKGEDKDDFYAKFNMNNGACSLLEENGLCALQLEKGHKALPFVCRNFPRRERYHLTGYLEYSLSLACEAVLELLWNLPNGIDFRISSLTGDDIRNLSVDKPTALISNASKIQDICISIIQDRRLPMPQRIVLMGAKLQELIKEDADIPVLISKTKAMLSDPDAIMTYKSLVSSSEHSKLMYINNSIKTLTLIIKSSTAFNDDYTEIINSLMHIEDENITFNMSAYSEAETAFSETFGDIEYFFENLAVSLLFHMKVPDFNSSEELWKSYVTFCNIYSLYRFVSIMSTKAVLPVPTNCSEDKAPLPGSREALFQLLTIVSRSLLHGEKRSEFLRDEFFENDSATLAHMAILVCG